MSEVKNVLVSPCYHAINIWKYLGIAGTRAINDYVILISIKDGQTDFVRLLKLYFSRYLK